MSKSSRFIKFFLILQVILLSNISIAAAVVMQPITPPVPTTFETVSGIVLLKSESMTGKDISVSYPSLPNFSANSALTSTGAFNLSVATDIPYRLKAVLTFNSLPDVTFSIGTFTALTQSEPQTIDLARDSGRVLGQVEVFGGKANTINIFANATTTINSVTELYTINADPLTLAVPTSNPELLMTFPAGVSANFSGTLDIITDTGCVVKGQSLPIKTTTLTSSETAGIENPDKLLWTVDVSNVTCSTGSINGNILVDGFDSALLINHEVNFSGNNFVTKDITEFGSFIIDSVPEGQYTVFQTSTFKEPYTSLSFAQEEINVLGATPFNSSNTVSTTHGILNLKGDWDFSHLTSVVVNASGSDATSRSMFASDNINIENAVATSKGEFDFILAQGNWKTGRYSFKFNSSSLLTTRPYDETLTLSPSSGELINNHVVESTPNNLPENNIETASAVIDLSIAQSSGQETVKIESLDIRGDSSHIDPATNAVYGKSTIRISSTDTAASEFKFTFYGLPGVYNLTASGLGSDGRTYSAPFEVTLGEVVVVPPGNDNGDMACFAINKVKIHQHTHKNKSDKNKLYIKNAAFRLPENAVVDLDYEDVSISIDGQVYDFPAGSFTKKSHKQYYKFKSEKGANPQIKAYINFDKSKWGIKVNKTDTLFVDINEGLDIDVSLSIAGFTGTENVLLKSKNKHNDKFKFKRKPKVSCDLAKNDKGKDKDDDDDDHDDDENDDDDDDKSKKDK